ncbi:MAG: hypothetical protein GAK31_02731 [Stenotrophomonas maltophilia]|uniref:Glycosyl hydrolase n=1 Tax=Stenotrophomonas maltophilia TaxID=40324 RepID=A0A7V8FGT2_STEMA|nr:MAG: hypothetical protein GAK31_02731 [Stenotrophomonas maltophilia]
MDIRARRSSLGLALWAALLAPALPAVAAPVGNLASVTADGPHALRLRTDSGSLLRIDVLAADIVRVQAGRNGALTGAGDKAAPIVLPQPDGAVQAQLEEDAQEIRVHTPALLLHVQRQPLRLRLERLDNCTAVPL